MGRFLLLLLLGLYLFSPIDLVPLNPVDDILLLLLAFSSGVVTGNNSGDFSSSIAKIVSSLCKLLFGLALLFFLLMILLPYIAAMFS